MTLLGLPSANGALAPQVAAGAGHAQTVARPVRAVPGQAPAPGDTYGFSVAISGATVLIGAPGAGNNAGAVYVFARSGKTWHRQAVLRQPHGKSWNEFGWSVAVSSTVSGTIAVVGAPGTGSFNGAAYIYARTGTTWHLRAARTDPGSGVTDDFGTSVAVSRATAVIGADGSGNGPGVVYVFARGVRGWHRQAVLADPRGGAQDEFGYSVGISGPTAVVGAWRTKKGAGLAYVFGRHRGGGWSRQATLAGPHPAALDNFGWSVAISGTTVVIGASGVQKGGVAYIYARSGGSWSRRARLAERRPAAGNEFGYAVAVSGTRVLVGDPRKARHRCGAAFEFARSGRTWALRAQVVNPGCAVGDWFGASAAVSGTTAVIGAEGAHNQAGAAYVTGLP